MAGAIGASLLIVAALTVAMVSALTSVGVVQSPFATAPAVNVVATPADSAPAGVDVPGGSGTLPQEQRCPCP